MQSLCGIMFLFLVLFTATVNGQIPVDSLVGYYPFNNNVNDESIYLNHGVVYGATPTEDRFGQTDSAYLFNGIDQYLEIPDADQLSIGSTDKLSISVWMRIDTLDFPASQNNYVHWMGKGVSGQHEWTFRIYNLNSTRPNRTSCYAYNTSGGLGAGSYVQEGITIGEWIHYVAVYNYTSDSIFLYKNGVLRDADNFSDYSIIPGNGTAPLRIGTRDLNSYYKGVIDDIRIYSRVLNDTEINSLYHENGWDEPLGILSQEKSTTFKIFPNPFNPVTTIRFDIPAETQHPISLQVYDISGRMVKTLVNKKLKPGQHEIQWNASQHSSGVYFLRMETALFSKKQKMILLK